MLEEIGDNFYNFRVEGMFYIKTDNLDIIKKKIWKFYYVKI